MANLFLTGSGAPTSGIGEATDYYRDRVTNLIYYKDSPTNWVGVPSLIPTPDGVGTTWLYGNGEPSNSIGEPNDYYRNEDTAIIYRKDGSNQWQPKGTLDFIGVYGVQWGNGLGAPANTVPLNNLPAGSFYLDVQTSDIYFKNDSLAWVLKGQLGGGGGSGGSVTVVDSLTSTSTTAALSANQGNALNSRIGSLETNKADLVGGVVPSAQLPSYVDDVLEYANLAAFPITGESGKVYVALDTNKTYRWSGSTYIQIGSDLALGETLATAYRGDRGVTAYDHSQATGNPHGATTADINDSTDKRYVTDAQHTRVNTAASSSNDGYLTSTDWNTFNTKEQGGYITVSSSFTAEVGKKYRTVWGLSSAITITPPATAVNGAYFTVFYTYMTSTGSVTCTNPNISAGPKDTWQEYEYTYDTTSGGWLPLRKSLGSIVPTGNSFQLVNPTSPDAKFIIQAPTSAGLYTLTMPNANVDLTNVAQAAATNSDGYLTSTDWNTFNGKLGLSDLRYSFLSDTGTTYIVPASAVTATGHTIIELSNSSLTSITVDTATGTGKTSGDSVNISITGTYAAQVLTAGAGVTLQGDLTFSYQHQTKTLVYKGSDVWKVVG